MSEKNGSIIKGLVFFFSIWRILISLYIFNDHIQDLYILMAFPCMFFNISIRFQCIKNIYGRDGEDYISLSSVDNRILMMALCLYFDSVIFSFMRVKVVVNMIIMNTVYFSRLNCMGGKYEIWLIGFLMHIRRVE